MSYNGFDISGKVCLVTGGTSGLGKAIAMGFVKSGCKVVAGSSSAGKVDSVRKELGSEHDAFQIDVSDEKSVDAAMKRTLDKYSRLDAVVNAAGVIQKVPSLDMPVSEFERIVKINLTGSFIVARAAARVMKEQKPDERGHRGSIVMIASLNSYISLSEVLAYASSKSGVLGLIRGLANEWAPIGIRVNGIAPGVFPTDLNRKLLEGTPRGATLKAHTCLNRFGDTEEIVGAALYLVSPCASYTHGHTLTVDGGFLAKAV